MNKANINRQLNCAIYTRKSTDEGLDKEFNSLDAQRECAEAYIKSQTQEGCKRSPAPVEESAAWSCIAV